MTEETLVIILLSFVLGFVLRGELARYQERRKKKHV